MADDEKKAGKCLKAIQKLVPINADFDINEQIIKKRLIKNIRLDKWKVYEAFKESLVIDDDGVRADDSQTVDLSKKIDEFCIYQGTDPKQPQVTLGDEYKDTCDKIKERFSEEIESVIKTKNAFIEVSSKKDPDYNKEDVFDNYEEFIFAYETVEKKVTEFLALSDDESVVDHILKQVFILRNNPFLSTSGQDQDGTSNLTIAQLNLNLSKAISRLDEMIQEQFDSLLHTSDYQQVESNWRGIEDLLQHVDFSKNIKIDLLDVAEEELRTDFENNSVDISNTELFKKIYFREYDQYGGLPYGCLIGLFELENNQKDKAWIEVMGKIANAAHAPYIASVGPSFFGCRDITELSRIKDLKGLMDGPKFDRWNDFRDSDEAAYIGLTLPRYMVRAPYDGVSNTIEGINYVETINKHDDYLWASSALLFVRNLIKSFGDTQWSQTIRGPKNGGIIENLPRHSFSENGVEMAKASVEMVIADFNELAFAECGFIPLIDEKGAPNACFFSTQSIKKPKKFKDPLDSENSQLVTNLSYTFSITKLAHYIKCIMRDNIGSTADAAYITKVIKTWLSQYVTTVENPDDLTLRNYPFKAISVDTFEREGMVGWYDCDVKVKPHLQFEGFDAELQLEVRL